MRQQADFEGGTGTIEINLHKNLEHGLYHLEIKNQAGDKKVIKVFQ